MKTKSRTAVVLLTMLLAVTVGLVIAQPAQAAYSDCPTGVSCLWTQTNGQGTRKDLPYSVYNTQTCHNLDLQPVSGYHSAKGGYGGGFGLEVFSDFNCRGTETTLRNGAVINYWAPLKINSFFVEYSCCTLVANIMQKS
jgi:peptidase inhibitor family I36